MYFSPNQIRLIELLCPYEQLEDFRAREIFSKILVTRKQGYTSRHQQNSLPMDTCDFIGNHYVIAVEVDEKLIPVGSYRTLSTDMAKKYNVSFPLLAMLQASGAQEVHDEVMHKLFLTSHQNAEINYVSSWTFSPTVKQDPAFAAVMKELITAMNVYSTLEKPNQIRFACGIPRLKTDQYIGWLGYQRLTGTKGDLPLIKQSNLCGEPVQLMILENGHSQEAIELAKKYQSFWDARLCLAPTTAEEAKEEAEEIKQAA